MTTASAMSEPPTRKVPMKVLCLGMSRTGTMSLRVALQELGYHDVYHFQVPSIERPDHCEVWVELFQKKFERKEKVTLQDFERVFVDFMAITDSPSVFFYQELLEAYPEAKVIVQSRDVESWYRSYLKNLWPVEDEWYMPTWNPYRIFFQLFLPHDHLYNFMKLQLIHAHGVDFPQTGKDMYVEHYQGVRKRCKQLGRPILDYRVSEGWDPICRFLGNSQPRKEFPRLNDTKTFQKLWAPLLEQVRADIHKKMILSTVGFTGFLSAAFVVLTRTSFLSKVKSR